MNTSDTHTAQNSSDIIPHSQIKTESNLSQDFGKIITKLKNAQLGILTYDSSLTASIVQKVTNFLTFKVSQETKNKLIHVLQQGIDSPHLILTNHKTYINIALIQSYLYTILQQEKNLTISPSQRHTIVGPRVTYDPVFGKIGRSLSNLVQTIPQTTSIEGAFSQLKGQGYSEMEINTFKRSCLLTFGRQRNNVLYESGLIFLAPSGTSEPIDRQGKIVLASDQELPGSIKLIQRYANTGGSATIITTDEDFEQKVVHMNASFLTNEAIHQILAEKNLMQTIANTAGGTVKDQQIITTMKEKGKVYPLPIRQLIQLFAS